MIVTAAAHVDTGRARFQIRRMNAFQAIGPGEQGGIGPVLDVTVYLDPAGDFWIAEADALPLATEAATLDALVARVWEVAPEIAALNGYGPRLNLRFVLNTADRT